LTIVEHGGDADALRAIEAMLSRVCGRPTERVETVEVREPETVEQLRAMSVDERAALIRPLQAQGRLAPLLPGTIEAA
jgi:hypothetical protein